MEIGIIRKRVVNSSVSGLQGVLAVVDTLSPTAHGLKDEWRAVLTPFWGASLSRHSTAATTEELADWLGRTGISPQAAAQMQFVAFAVAAASLTESDAAIAYAGARLSRGGAAKASSDDEAVSIATAPPPGFASGLETRIAAAGSFAVATEERNVHGAFGAAGGAALLTLWKSLQDETTAASAAGASRGTGQDIYFGILAASVPLMAAAVGFSMTLIVATQMVRSTDVSAARYLSLPPAARYADVITFVAGALSAAVAHASLLRETPQGPWVTWIFVGASAGAFLLLVAACTVFLALARKPFSSPSLHASYPALEDRFGRMLSAGGAWRRGVAAAAFADRVRERACADACSVSVCAPAAALPMHHIPPPPSEVAVVFPPRTGNIGHFPWGGGAY